MPHVQEENDVSFTFYVNIRDKSVLLCGQKYKFHIRICEGCGCEVQVPYVDTPFEKFAEFRQAIEESERPFLCSKCRAKHEEC